MPTGCPGLTTVPYAKVSGGTLLGLGNCCPHWPPLLVWTWHPAASCTQCREPLATPHAPSQCCQCPAPPGSPLEEAGLA